MRSLRPPTGWLPWRRLRPDIGFGAFISYSGPADRALISKLQNGIEKLAKRWYRPPVMKVFVDKTSIAAGTRLWSRIESGLSRSKWLILMASPEAAQSWWVDREVGWWVRHRSLDDVIIVHTAGVLRWDRDVNDFSADSDAIPPCLRGKFEDEPVWVAVPRTEGGADVEAAVLSITSAVRETSIHELSSHAYREHRRTLRWAGGAIATLSLLLVVAVALSMVAVIQKRHADQQARIALSRQLASMSATELSTDARAALLLAVSAYRIDANAQTLAALMRADTANPRLMRYYDAGSTVTLLGGSSDGKTLVAGGADGRVLRWSFTDPKPTTVIKLSSAIASIGVSGDGSVIAATDKHNAALWRSGHDAVPLPVPPGQTANAVAVSPSGQTAVVSRCSSDGRFCVADASHAVVDASDVIFDVATVSQRAVHRNPDFAATYLVASSDDDLLLFDSLSTHWQRRRIPDWALTESGTIPFGAHQVNSEPSADGEFVSATNGSTTVGVWQLRGSQTIDTSKADLTAHAAITSEGDALALSPHGTALAIADEGSIYVAPVAPANAVIPVAGISEPEAASGVPARAPTVQLAAAGTIKSVGLLSFLGGDSRLASATGSHIALWDLRQIDRLARATMTVFDSSPCNGCGPPQVSVSPDGKHAAVVGVSAAAVEPLPGMSGMPRRLPGLTGIALWRKDGHLLVINGKGQNGAAPPISSNAIRVLTVPGADSAVAAGLTPDQRSVVAVDSDGAIFVLDADTGSLRDTIPGLPEFEANRGRPYQAANAVSSAGDLVARIKRAGSSSDPVDESGTVSIYDVANHRSTGSIPGADITMVRYAGPLLLVQRANRNLELWDERGTAMSRVISGEQGYNWPATADAHGRLVARLRAENAIDLFDVDTGTLVDSIAPYPNSFRTGYAFSPDGSVFVTDIARQIGGSSATDVLVARDLSPRALLTAACAAAGDNLSPDEWEALAGISPAGIPTC
jgi:WD40 repeat protein